MQLHYIHHSCFAAEEEDCLIVFDYWLDPERLLHRLLDNAHSKAVYFIVSHFHQDHYNSDIPQWCADNPNWHLLPSYDTVRRRRIDKSLPLAILRFGEEVSTPHFHLKAYRSTDVGVCTVITLREIKIGDAVLHNVDASVVKSQKAPLLLGQSAMERFGTITIDNQNNKLIIKH